MSDYPKNEKLEAFKILIETHLALLNKRRDIAWKFNYALWLTLAASISFQLGTNGGSLPSMVRFIYAFVVALSLVVYVYWFSNLRTRNQSDQNQIFEAEDMLMTLFDIKYSATLCRSIEKAKSQRQSVFDWSTVSQVALTILLGVTVLIVTLYTGK